MIGYRATVHFTDYSPTVSFGRQRFDGDLPAGWFATDEAAREHADRILERYAEQCERASNNLWRRRDPMNSRHD